MLKNILFDYKMLFTWKNVKKQLALIISFMYWIFIIPLWIDNDSDITFVSYLIVLFCIVLWSRICTNQVPKMFYLCPISKEERRNYVVVGYWFRTIVPILVFIVIQCILWITKYCMFKDIIGGTIHLIIFSMAMNLYVGETEEQSRRKKTNNEVIAAVNLWQIWSIISLCISSLIVFNLSFTMEDIKAAPAYYVASAIVFLLAALPTAYFVKCYYPKIMNDTTSYESRKGMI